MAEEAVAIPTQQDTPVQYNGISPEVKQLMDLSLNIGKPYVPPVQQEDAPIVQDQPVVDTPAPSDSPNPSPDGFSIFKEKYGYQSPDDAIKEIEEYRQLKANPQTPEFTFENEDSKRIYQAISKGDKKAVFEILAKQERLETLTALEVNKDTAADIIKTAIGIENPDLSPAEVEFEFKQRFTIPKEPKEPVQRTTEEDDEFKERHDDWQDRHNEWKESVTNLEMKAIVAAKMAKPKLDAAKAQIVFPEIEADIDEGYAQYRKELEEQPRLKAEVEAEYKTFKPEAIEARVKFTDEQSKIDFEYHYVPDIESFNKTVELVSDIDKFYSLFKDQAGKPDRRSFLEVIHFGLNKDKIILEALKQSKNATIKASLPDNSGGTQRQFPQRQELSEVDKLMQMSLQVR